MGSLFVPITYFLCNKLLGTIATDINISAFDALKEIY